MPERPLLSLQRPQRVRPNSKPPPREKVTGLGGFRQSERLGPKFDRLSEVIDQPGRLAEFRDDPAAIVPERALVFVVTGTMADFYKAVYAVPGLEFVGEDEDEIEADEDWNLAGDMTKPVPRRLYFTIPDRRALQEIISLWRRFATDQPLGRGKAPWREVFKHLDDVRVWGPQDRLSPETLQSWAETIRLKPNDPVRFEVELWYRDNVGQREQIETSFREEVERLEGRVLDRAVIPPIHYHAVLVEVPAALIQALINHPTVGLAEYDRIFSILPQAVICAPQTDNEIEGESLRHAPPEGELAPPVAALFDGLPLANNVILQGRLDIDDPDDFASLYGRADEQVHGTSMASIILHGDLNTNFKSIQQKLYVRPVMFPQQDIFDSRKEYMPTERLAIDLIWAAVIRMMGDTEVQGTASSVRFVNISLGDAKRRFSGVLSPWAKLIDHLSWKHNLLFIVSAGNVTDQIPLPDVTAWSSFESCPKPKRQSQILASIFSNRAARRILSPAESVNALTVGACSDDHVSPTTTGVFAVIPYFDSSLPNPSSALGLGYQRAVKPEILLPGGLEQVRTRRSHAPIEVEPAGSPNPYFGIKAAAALRNGRLNNVALVNGTSAATALATHYAILVYENLVEIFSAIEAVTFDSHYYSLLTKTLLVHTSRWSTDAAGFIKMIVDPDDSLHHEHLKAEQMRILGFGRADVNRALDCSERRVSLLGWGALREKEADRYRVPLPQSLENIPGYRAVTITIGWFSPANLNHRSYRMAKLEARPGGDKNLSLRVDNAQAQPSHNAVGRGTVYHRRWEKDEAAAFVDGGDMIVDIVCNATAGNLDVAIPYGLAITIEVGENVPVDVYSEVLARIQTAARVPAH